MGCSNSKEVKTEAEVIAPSAAAPSSSRVVAAAASPVSEISSNSPSSDYFPLITKSPTPQSPTNSGKKSAKNNASSSSLYHHLLGGLTPLTPSSTSSNEKTSLTVRASQTLFWKEATNLCVTRPSVASYIDPNTHGTPLHVACSLGSTHIVDNDNDDSTLVLGNVILKFLQTLITTNPSAISQRDKRYHLPLDGVIAGLSTSKYSRGSSSSSSSNGVLSASFICRMKAVKLLLEHYNYTTTTTQSTSTALLDGKVLYQIIYSLPDDVETPLGSTVEFVEFIARKAATQDTNNIMILSNTTMDDDILALLYRRFVRQFDQSERFFEGDNSRVEVINHRLWYKNAAVNTFHIIELLLKYSCSNNYNNHPSDNKEDDNLLVHNAVRAGSCPPDLLRYIVETNLDMVAQPDTSGNLPLHYAAGLTTTTTNTPPPPESYSKYVIDELLYAYPEGAALVNANGVLPITMAIESKKKWIGGGIRSLHEAHPAGIEQVELDEGHPLLRAISSFQTLEEEDENEYDESSVFMGQFGDDREGSMISGLDGGGGRRRKRQHRTKINKDESHDAIMLVQRPDANLRDVVMTMWANEEDGGVQMLGCTALEIAATTILASIATAAGGEEKGRGVPLSKMLSLKVASVALLGVTAVVNAMKNHPNEAAIQEKACSALTAMASADGEREVSFAASGAISAIVCAMQAHVSDATVQKEACRALHSIAAKGGAERATVVASVSGLTALVNALAAHPMDRHVQCEACRALETLTSYHDAYLPQLHEQTETLLQSAATSFPEDCFVSTDNILINLRRAQV